MPVRLTLVVLLASSACVVSQAHQKEGTGGENGAKAFPGSASAAETSNGVKCLLGKITIFRDLDLDGYGDDSKPKSWCKLKKLPTKWTKTPGDCDDHDDSINPGMAEVWYDGVDQGCDGGSDWDADHDGHDIEDDCDDEDPDVIECEPEVDLDLDDDGYSEDVDCDDSNSEIHPGAVEVFYDGADSDCDGLSDFDSDTDGYDSSDYGGDDCDDLDPEVHVDAVESCMDGLDNDCDSVVDGCQTDLSTADAVIYGNLAEQRIGQNVAGIGDVNGDGYDDVAVSGTNSYVYVFYAPISGEIDVSTADVTIEISGGRVAGAGDVNKDGTPDILVGVPGGVGTVYLFGGDVTGTVTAASALATITGEHAGDSLGSNVAGLGDLDSDGYADFGVIAYLEDSGGTDAGAVYIFHGPVVGTVSASTAFAKLKGENAGDMIETVAPAGDFNNDGIADIIVGVPKSDVAGTDSGSVYVVSGSATGTVSLASSMTVIRGSQNDSSTGYAVSTVGDLTRDGIDDILVGAPNYDLDATNYNAGAVYVVPGGTVGVYSLASAPIKITGKDRSDACGTSIAVIGDLDGGGYPEIAVGAWLYGGSGGEPGAVAIFRGETFTEATSMSYASALLVGVANLDNAGGTIAPAGDIDGDGYGDLLIGARESDHGGNAAGVAYLVSGGGL